MTETRHCGVCDMDIPLSQWNDSHTEFKATSMSDAEVLAAEEREAEYWSRTARNLEDQWQGE